MRMRNGLFGVVWGGKGEICWGIFTDFIKTGKGGWWKSILTDASFGSVGKLFIKIFRALNVGSVFIVFHSKAEKQIK